MGKKFILSSKIGFAVTKGLASCWIRNKRINKIKNIVDCNFLGVNTIFVNNI